MATIDMQSTMGVVTVVSGTTIIDTEGYEALTFALQHGNTTSIAFVHGDESDLSDGVAVPSDFIIGDTSFTDTGAALVGYVGKRRYVRATLTNPVASTSVFALEGARRNDNTLPPAAKL